MGRDSAVFAGVVKRGFTKEVASSKALQEVATALGESVPQGGIRRRVCLGLLGVLDK